MPTLRRHAHRFAAALAVLLIGAGAAVEVGVRRHVGDARGDLPRALAAARAEADEASAPVLEEATTALARRDLAGASRVLARAATERPDATGLHVAALAASARGDLAEGARQAVLASRLAPGDARRAAAAERALDAALLGALRPFAWGALALGTLLLVAAGAVTARRRSREEARRAYVAHLEGALRARPTDAGLRLDLFLAPRPGAAPLPAPVPGPTLTVLLSNPEASRTVRLAARRDVREDAVRIPLGDATLAEVRAHLGPWRAVARLDGTVVAEARLPADPLRRAPVPA